MSARVKLLFHSVIENEVSCFYEGGTGIANNGHWRIERFQWRVRDGKVMLGFRYKLDLNDHEILWDEAEPEDTAAYLNYLNLLIVE